MFSSVGINLTTPSWGLFTQGHIIQVVPQFSNLLASSRHFLYTYQLHKDPSAHEIQYVPRYGLERRSCLGRGICNFHLLPFLGRQRTLLSSRRSKSWLLNSRPILALGSNPRLRPTSERFQDMKKGDSEATDRVILKAYGKTVQTNNLGVNQYIIADTQNIQTILATQVDKFGNEPLNRKPCQPLLGDGIMTRDGAFWKRSRNLINPIFSRAQVSTLAPFEVHVGKMINRIP